VNKLQFLLSHIDLKNLLANKKSRRDRLARKVFFACQNMHPLDKDDFEGEEKENLFEEFERNYYLVNINSNLADKLQDIQMKLLATMVSQ
jgi:hypothetical protein